MFLIVGLGNPGMKYAKTRHNIGFRVVDRLAEQERGQGVTFYEEKKFHSLIADTKDSILIKPLTYMNDSGRAVQSILQYYKEIPSHVWVIHDDIDLPLGQLRIRSRGRSGGHRGVASIIEHVGTEQFMRFKCGIGRGSLNGDTQRGEFYKKDVMDYVLFPFSLEEEPHIRSFVDTVVDAVHHARLHGIDTAMNMFNNK